MAMKRFTSEFGMDSGGTTTLFLPGILFYNAIIIYIYINTTINSVKQAFY
ncbi:hypothetical protein F3C69_02495 [Buchnera aphidicola (Aphis craccivore)]|nr:hypothetical protein F3C69_02495 [Buchnera aphidicola (Aphis craccivore)]